MEKLKYGEMRVKRGAPQATKKSRWGVWEVLDKKNQVRKIFLYKVGNTLSRCQMKKAAERWVRENTKK